VQASTNANSSQIDAIARYTEAEIEDTMTVPEEIEASVHPDNSDIPTTHHTTMFSFKLLTTSPQAVITCARLGQLITRSGKIQTPNFIAPSSRGVVPHLSQDNLRDHTKIPGVYVAVEDCMFPLCWRAQRAQ
jgi:hypothetical protein